MTVPRTAAPITASSQNWLTSSSCTPFCRTAKITAPIAAPYTESLPPKMLTPLMFTAEIA